MWNEDPRVKPPFGAAEIDWGHPLTAGLFALYLFSEGGGVPVDLCGHVGITRTGATFVASALGPAMSFSGTTDRLTATQTPAADAPLSMAAWFLPADVTVLGTVMGVSDGAVTRYDLLYFRGDVGGNPVQHFCNGATTFSTGQSSNGVLGVNTWNHVVTVTATASSRAAYLNGVKTADTTNIGSQATMDRLGIACRPDAVQLFNGQIAFAAFWSTALSDELAAWLYAEPYAMLRPIVRRAWFSFPAGGTPPPPSVVVFRRTLSALGTRVGARQTHKGAA